MDSSQTIWSPSPDQRPWGNIPPGLLRFYTLMGTFVPIFTAGAAPKGG